MILATFLKLTVLALLGEFYRLFKFSYYRKKFIKYTFKVKKEI